MVSTVAERQTRSAPLVEAFGKWLKEQRARVSPKSRLGEKLGYIARHWDGLQLFLTDGRVEMDSNSVENLARPIALTRKNALFAGHDEGAPAAEASLNCPVTQLYNPQTETGAPCDSRGRVSAPAGRANHHGRRAWT